MNFRYIVRWPRSFGLCHPNLIRYIYLFILNEDLGRREDATHIGTASCRENDAEAHADCCDQSRVISHMVARMMNIHNPVSVGSCLPVRRFLVKVTDPTKIQAKPNSK